jgi:anthranilate synthase component I
MHSYYPNRDEFARRARNGNLTPVYTEILADMETPVSAFRKIRSGEYSFLLESVEGGERLARYSFLGTGPDMVLRGKGRDVVTERNGTSTAETVADGQDVLDILKRELNRVRYVADPDLPRFCGGAVGFLGYDLVRFFEDIPEDTVDDLNLPDCLFIFTDTLLIFDHVKHRIRVVCNARIDGNPDEAYDAAKAKIEAMIAKLRTPFVEPPPHPSQGRPQISSNFTKDEFEASVARCKEYIAAGDAIQVVLSQRFSAPTSGDQFDIYRALRSFNPSPYMYFLEFGDIRLIGSSPEILVTQEQGTVRSRPIAGTRPRGATPEKDSELEHELLADEKERAEHIMLVDLGRNDLGRVCRYGTVVVDDMMTIERYSHVMHIVSNVVGKLRMDADQFDLLRAAFPAGTVSGAPKVRAMEIIEELEPTRRGTYAGAIGYFSYSGDMDTCITIRTILTTNGTAYVQAGAGIVADSDPASEYQETMNKAMAMVNAINAAAEGLD